MQTLWRYIGRQFFGAFLGSLLILALVVLVVDMLVNIDEVLAISSTATGALFHLLTRTAALYLPYLIPIAVFTGAFVCLGQSARTSEIIAIKAGGVAPLRALVPVFVIASGIAVAALFSGEFLSVGAASALNQLRGNTDPALAKGSVWYHTGRFIFNIRDHDPASETVKDVRVYERDGDGRLIRSIVASEATRLAPQRWMFRDATIRRFLPDDPHAEPMKERLNRVELELAEDRSPRLREAEMAGLPVWSLWSYARSVRAEGGNPGRAGELVHERLTIPFLVVLFALLAIPLGLRVEQTRSLSLPALQGVVLLFLFVCLREYGDALVPLGVSPAVAPWGGLLLFFGYGGWQLSRVSQ
ncbi:MAG: LptF/LptG family permease [Myxococcota bacterium]|nr:LptF/LptG family permease [Myxococcota bacterium]